MQDSDNNSEEYLKKVLETSPPAVAAEEEERIARTLASAQRKTNTRDIILLVFVRFWMVLTEFTCKISAKSSKH
ncbi:MAG: hypothetical protein OEM27_05100 [Nitrospinota bacterium]|nr:hypothetical protein [Nitrospinota bacterium]